MNFSDETLGGYIDGELDATMRSEVAAAIASDPAVASRIEELRALQNKLQTAFSGVVQEPVPQRLIDIALATPMRSGVTDLTQVRAARRAARPRWTWPEFGALAASAMVASVAGYFLLRSPGSAVMTPRSGELLADGTLARALTRELASEQARDAAVRMGISFRNKGGDYCRTFALQRGQNVAGLACREGGGWRVQALAHTERASGVAEPAGSSLPRGVLEAVESQISGEPLDAAAEAAARQSNWGMP